jgi:hypothetical protein
MERKRAADNQKREGLLRESPTPFSSGLSLLSPPLVVDRKEKKNIYLVSMLQQ